MTPRGPRGPYKTAPHPQEDAIRELLAEGLNNAQVVERLTAPPRVVAKVREDMGIGPAPRSTWRTEHPKDAEIRQLLREGHTDAEIHRRTGADHRAIGRRRVELGVKATIIRRATRRHPREADILAALRAGGTNSGIARELGVDKAAVARIRRDNDIADVPQQPLTLDEKWQANTEPVDGGHLRWTGQRAKVSGTPLLAYKGKVHSAAKIAFRRRTGRDPVGPTYAECGYDHCVDPAHVDDEPGRLRVREQLRNVLGLGPRPETCAAGHDQAVEGRLQNDGVPYCQACKRDAKRAARATSTT